MAYDEILAARVGDVLAGRDAVAERKMFGGIAWMLDGNMACVVLGDELVVRLSLEDAERALAGPYTRRFDMSGRPSRGMVVVAGEAVAEDAELARWVDAGAAHAGTLPPK